MEQGVFRYRRPPRLSSEKEREGIRERLEYEERSFNDLWRTLPRSKGGNEASEAEHSAAERKKSLNLPEENLLYFLEKNSLILEPWQREILRIVRVIAQYFYPQRQTQVMNEGCATFVHYTIMNTLFDQGRISEGAMLEILQGPFERGFPAGIRRSTLFAHQSLRAGLCHDAGHPAHLDGADRRGSRLVSRHRRQRRLARDAARRLGQSSR